MNDRRGLIPKRLRCLRMLVLACLFCPEVLSQTMKSGTVGVTPITCGANTAVVTIPSDGSPITCASAGAVTSFSGDGGLITNSSSTGAITATLAVPHLDGAIDPRSTVSIFDDFLGGGTATTTVGNLNWSSSGTVSYPADSGGSYGLVRAQSAAGTTGSNSDVYGPGTTSNPHWNYSASKFDTLIRVQINKTTNISFFAGMNDLTADGEAGNSIGIAYDTTQADTNFTAVCKSGGTATRTSLGVAADTAMHTLRIRSTTVGTILFSIDGGAETSIATHVPSALMSPITSTVVAANGGVTNFTQDYYWQQITSNVTR